MAETYFIIENGRQVGPIVRQELKYHNLTPNSYVWREGLENWVQASMLPELADIVFGAPDSTVPPMPGEAPLPPRPQYSQPQSYSPQPTETAHTNWMPWAIACTVCGFLFSCIAFIFGIIGMTQASKANNFYANGMKAQGDSANGTARTMCIIAMVLIGISIIGFLVLAATGVLAEVYEILD